MAEGNYKEKYACFWYAEVTKWLSKNHVTQALMRQHFVEHGISNGHVCVVLLIDSFISNTLL